MLFSGSLELEAERENRGRDLEDKIQPFLKIWPSQAKLFPQMQKEVFRGVVDDLMGYD